MDSKLHTLSDNYKKVILLEFTKQLLLNTYQHKYQIEEDYIKEQVQNIVNNRPRKKSKKTNEHQLTAPLTIHTKNSGKIKKPSIFKEFLYTRKIPLPHAVKDIKPIPHYTEIDLKKIQPLVRDPTVSSIICNGPDQDILVRLGSEKKPTSIQLDLQEIDQIVETFAFSSKIPIEDFYKVVVGNLEITVIDPRGNNPKFIITKILPHFTH